jgi:hypothetical protein
MTDDDLEAELKRREERMKILPGTFTDVTNEEGPEQPDAGRDAAAG